MPETNARIKVCHDTAANFQTNNPTLLVGEWALETDTKKMKIGDGSTAYNALPYSTAEDSEEWAKPADWIDMRSGAFLNNIYLLVAHSADFSTYPTAIFKAEVNSGTFDVFIDGFKYKTSSSNSEEVSIDWAQLNLTTGYTITHPSELKAHIIRICPSDNSKNFSYFCWGTSNHSSYPPGLLWAHYCIDYKISIFSAFGVTARGCTTVEAITAHDNVLKVNTASQAFARCGSLKTLPILDFDNANVSTAYILYNLGSSNLKKLHFRNLKQVGSVSNSDMIHSALGLKEIILENSSLCWYWGTFGTGFLYSLKKIPEGVYMHPTSGVTCRYLSSLEPTILDFSSKKNFPSIEFCGDSTHPVRGLKGLLFSPEATLDNTNSPQIKIDYTGLDRSALVNLFKSMPYNVGYTVVGSPTIMDGVASGFNGASNCITTSALSSQLFAVDKFEVMLAIIDINSGNIGQDTNGRLFWYGGNNQGISITNNGLAMIWTYDSANNAAYLWSTPPATGKCYVRFIKNGNTFTFGWSTDKTTWHDKTQEFETSPVGSSNPFYFLTGARAANVSKLDLNETYIAINGQPWFRGTAAMTKTCSVVGCAGTVDLTAEDKAIATGKGWELTVA